MNRVTQLSKFSYMVILCIAFMSLDVCYAKSSGNGKGGGKSSGASGKSGGAAGKSTGPAGKNTGPNGFGLKSGGGDGSGSNSQSSKSAKSSGVGLGTGFGTGFGTTARKTGKVSNVSTSMSSLSNKSFAGFNASTVSGFGKMEAGALGKAQIGSKQAMAKDLGMLSSVTTQKENTQIKDISSIQNQIAVSKNVVVKEVELEAIKQVSLLNDLHSFDLNNLNLPPSTTFRAEIPGVIGFSFKTDELGVVTEWSQSYPGVQYQQDRVTGVGTRHVGVRTPMGTLGITWSSGVSGVADSYNNQRNP